MSDDMADAARSAERTPVIIGVGQVNDRGDQNLDARGLMRRALEEADRDAGGGLLGRIDWLGVEDQISFPDTDIHDRVADDLPRRPALVVRTPEAIGDGPMRLINDAARLIAAGDIACAAAVGGEAMRTAAARAKAAVEVGEAPPADDRLRSLAEAQTSAIARRYGLATPTEVYPLYEQASRSAYGQTLAQAQAESALIWSLMSQVAADNPAAWLRDPVVPDVIETPTPNNRIVSFPYPKLMIANSAVNQGAAVIVASVAFARSLGIPDALMIHIGAGAAAQEPDDYLQRDGYDASPSLTATIEQVLARNRLTTARIDHVELYSCFPCVPKMARRVLGWPADRPATVYGGLTFGGGPIGNCMMHAAAAMVLKLRASKGIGLIVANGGFATHNHAIALSSEPEVLGDAGRDYDVKNHAAALRQSIPALVDDYRGPATIETYSVPYDRVGPRYGVIVARTDDGRRFLAHVPREDEVLLRFLVDGEDEPVGSCGMGFALPDGRTGWKRDRGAYPA